MRTASFIHFAAAGILVAAACALAPVEPAAPLSNAIAVEPAGCKPQAPIDVVVQDVAVAGRDVTVRYTLVARIDALAVDTAIELPHGGAVVSRAAGAAAPVARGGSVGGSVRVRLPAGAASGEIALLGRVTFAADGDPARPETHATRVVVRVGVAPAASIEPALPSVETAGVRTLEVPALRVGGGR